MVLTLVDSIYGSWVIKMYNMLHSQPIYFYWRRDLCMQVWYNCVGHSLFLIQWKSISKYQIHKEVTNLYNHTSAIQPSKNSKLKLSQNMIGIYIWTSENIMSRQIQV
jgi:hypothetical protein